MSTEPTKRYAAKLLFCYRTVVPPERRPRAWTCEYRVVLLRARCAQEALEDATQRGKATQWDTLNDEGDCVRGEFLGVVELLCLELVAEDDAEVWYEMFEDADPDRLVPPVRELSAIRNRE